MSPWSNDFISIPFKDRGRSRDGADCWGLGCIVYQEMLGIGLPPLDDYSDTNDRKKLAALFEKNLPEWVDVPKGEEREFDFVVFNMVGLPMHVGIVLRPNYMIHCQRGIGTAIERYDSKKWNTRIEGFYRHANRASRTPAVFNLP